MLILVQLLYENMRYLQCLQCLQCATMAPDNSLYFARYTSVSVNGALNRLKKMDKQVTGGQVPGNPLKWR